MNMYSDEGKVEQYTNEMLRMYKQQNAAREANVNDNTKVNEFQNQNPNQLTNSNENFANELTSNPMNQNIQDTTNNINDNTNNNDSNINSKHLPPWLSGQNLPPASYRQDISQDTIRGDVAREYNKDIDTANTKSISNASPNNISNQNQIQTKCNLNTTSITYSQDNNQNYKMENGAIPQSSIPESPSTKPNQFTPFSSNTQDISNKQSTQPSVLNTQPSFNFNNIAPNATAQNPSNSQTETTPQTTDLKKPIYMPNPVEFKDDNARQEWDNFNSKNTSNGFLKVQVYSAQGALPTKDARVVVSKQFGNQPRVFYDMSTNESGITDSVSLPAPNASHSFTLDGVRPYETYDLEVSKQGFHTAVRKNMPIFPGVVSLQPIQMNPMLASDSNEQSDNIVETEPNF